MRSAQLPLRLRMRCHARLWAGLVLLSVLWGCRSRSSRALEDAKQPKQVPLVTLQRVLFHSAALQRDVPYLVYLPDGMADDAGPRPSVYLLHGAGADYRDWSVSSDVQPLAAAGYVLVMPEGSNAYDVNSATVARDRYEDFLATDLIADVEHRLPVAREASRRAIVGVSMGGFGALVLAMHHPDRFAPVQPVPAPAPDFWPGGERGQQTARSPCSASLSEYGRPAVSLSVLRQR